MYLAFNPPQMLPTVTLSPTATATSTGTKAKRAEGAYYQEVNAPLNKDTWQHSQDDDLSFIHRIDPNMMLYGGIGMCLFGGAAYLL